jgi:hypothetical protein
MNLRILKPVKPATAKVKVRMQTHSGKYHTEDHIGVVLIDDGRSEVVAANRIGKRECILNDDLAIRTSVLNAVHETRYVPAEFINATMA